MPRKRDIYLFLIDTFFVLGVCLFCFIITGQHKALGFSALLKLALIAVAVYPLSLLAFGTYRNLWRYARPKEFIFCFLSVMAASVLFYSISIAVIEKIPPLYFFILTAALIATGLCFLRLMYQMLLSYLKEIKALRAKNFANKKRTLIIGGGDACRTLLLELSENSFHEIYPVLICDKDPKKHNKRIVGIKIISDEKGYETICRENNIEQIIIAIPSADNMARARILKECAATNCPVKILPRISEMTGSRLVQDIRDITMEELLGREPVQLTNDDILNVIQGKTVMVTGGGGSIGSELCRQVAAHHPKKLIIIDIYENNAYDIQQELKRRHGAEIDLKTLIGTVRDRDWIHKIISQYRPDLIFHAAAHKHVPLMEASPAEAVKNNIFGTFNTAVAAGEAGVEKFILISTDKAVNPTNIMGATKRVCEMVTHSMCSLYPKTKFTSVRFGNVLGSNGSVIPLFRDQILDGGPVTVTHPEIIRYFMTIAEAAQLVLTSAAFGNCGEVFVLDMGDPVKIDDLARQMIRLSGHIPNEDIKIDYTGLRPGEKLYEELLTSEEGLIPTSNEKIFIGHQPDEDDTLLYYYMGRLKEIVHSQDKDNEISFEQGNANIEKILSSLVPTFRRISEEMQIEEKEHIDFIKNGFTPQKTTAVPAETG